MISSHDRGWFRLIALGVATALGLAAALGGCATVQDFAGIPRTGYQANGTYVVSADEDSMACRQIKERLDILNANLKALPEKTALEESDIPKTVGSAFGRMFGGPGAGLAATQEFQRATAESEALNALLVKKKCT